ncbi:[acyl-carrier-protein] S-malonyltransferase Ecym_8328 [Eremothecium cymbalariae DBVPG|uniref:[acyl-carrier-protein] S-malonyltransferase n=1 Tax=Eremothecium cymbalariae (strain CBS 270.75 / DBVPG 7215 / KCTC 17166 / NRRL Y-17582) TaxID=931890 RepID=G8JXN2_ERECY|nr:Hypothetical protein Ecym_8328 [Eremothecium cymbalariae DBVPG\
MKLFSFPGQGSSISLSALNKWCQSLSSFQDKNIKASGLLRYVGENLSKPGSIAICSNLLYEHWRNCDVGNGGEERVMVGHSLGELGALNGSGGNELFSLQEIFEIASFRHELMKRATLEYLSRQAFGEAAKFSLWALTCPRSKDLRGDLGLRGSLSLANHNSLKQCVITGFRRDLEALELPRLTKVVELVNPDNVPFHDERILHGIKERLYEYMWVKLQDNGNHTRTLLDHPIISGLDGKMTYKLHTALEKFVHSSTKTVEFVECCKTAKEMNIEHAVHIGPGTLIGKLVERNTGIPNHVWIGGSEEENK